MGAGGWAAKAGLVTVLGLLLAMAAPVWAQEVDDDPVIRASEYEDTDAGWEQQRFLVSGYGGRLTGGTSVGFSDNLLFQAQFEQGTDTAWGGRIGWVLAPRFDVELELGVSSPGLDAVLTDLQGQGRTVVPFSDLELRWLGGIVNYSVVERTRRFVPYLTLGVGAMSVSSDEVPELDTTEPVLLFGLGLRTRITGPVALRADIRGLRSGLRSKQEEDEELAPVFTGEFNGTNVLWTVGLEIRF